MHDDRHSVRFEDDVRILRRFFDLLSTCKLAHQESSLLFYSLNSFTFGYDDGDNSFKPFFDKLLPDQRKALRSIRFTLEDSLPFSTKAMTRMPNVTDILNWAPFDYPWENTLWDHTTLDLDAQDELFDIMSPLQRLPLRTANVILFPRDRIAEPSSDMELPRRMMAFGEELEQMSLAPYDREVQEAERRERIRRQVARRREEAARETHADQSVM